MDEPITLGLPLDAPEPPVGCGVCQALARQRAEAAARGDLSRVSDCNVEIRNHHEPQRRRSR
ncbi:hypothetical protein [Streptomyces sp. NPDC059862]|uniref:hypothetical protein n=1 Tax=unclassified Streptomyces TaxID=2593676 RepID=UPI0036365B06